MIGLEPHNKSPTSNINQASAEEQETMDRKTPANHMEAN
jgi:hypothetical protein